KKHEKYQSKNNPFTNIEEQFSSFVGLNNLKQTVKEIYATHIINEKRVQMRLSSTKQVLHMLFKANPGTGKTTVARELANIQDKIKVLTTAHFIEGERADLVVEYIGQTD